MGGELMREPGVTIWLTGLSSAGKSTVAGAVYQRLVEMGVECEWLDGDVMRRTLCRGLGFSREDRDENVARLAMVAGMLSRHGVVTIVSAISPYREARERALAMLGRFVEVFVDAPLEVCAARDCKGIYARSRAGEMVGVTGVDDPYEAPEKPDVHLRTDRQSVDECVAAVIGKLGLV